jgi:microtubule-associated protein-like 6
MQLQFIFCCWVCICNCRLVTYGQNHVKYWRLDRSNSSSSAASDLNATSDAGVFAKGGTHSVLSAVFLSSGVVLTGEAVRV